MDEAEYKEQRADLEERAKGARQTLIKARAEYDKICEKLRNLRIAWQEQQRADREAR